MSFENGPYVQAACFCDQIIEDKSGVWTLVRLIDRLEVTASGVTPPSDMPPLTTDLNLALLLKSGDAMGRSDLKIIPRLPSGESNNPLEMSIRFEGEEKGHNLHAKIRFTFEMEGLYWFDVYIDDTKLTTLPFRIVYNRFVTSRSGR